MKAFALAFLCCLFCAHIEADTIELRPAGPITGAYRWQCAATGFGDAQTVVGVCQEKYYSAARYIPPRVMGAWPVTWDVSGNPTLDPTQTAQWPGCFGTKSVVLIDQVPMYYIGADILGNQLTENYCYSYLVTP